MTPFLAVCDPPWNADAGGGGRGAQNHYGLEGVDGIAHAMRSAPPWRDTGPGLLWMWATSSAFVTGDAAVVARALGFRPCAGWVWAKVDELHCGGCQGLGDFGPLTSARETCPVCRGFGSVFLIVRARIEAAVERAADAAPRDSFPGLSHTTEVPRELE
mgnify:CR=1 FL=1